MVPDTDTITLYYTPFSPHDGTDATDLNVTFFPSYGAAMRGGTANCYVVISDEEIGAPVSNSVDDLVVMNGPSLHKFLPNLKPGGTLFINSSIVKVILYAIFAPRWNIRDSQRARRKTDRQNI